MALFWRSRNEESRGLAILDRKQQFLLMSLLNPLSAACLWILSTGRMEVLKIAVALAEENIFAGGLTENKFCGSGKDLYRRCKRRRTA